MRVLVTGANGFIGRAIVRYLSEDGHDVIAASRATIGNIETAAWDESLPGIEAIVHTAARVHQMHDTSTDPLAEFRRINRDATLRLAEAAKAAGVKRFIFISSVKAAVDHTGIKPIDETGPAQPQSPYGISKREAEEGLLKLTTSAFEPVILRLPLVYGPSVKGNFLSFIKLARLGLPLPLAGVHNQRSLLGLTNFVHAIQISLMQPGLGGEIFYLEDGAALSTRQLLEILAKTFGKPARLFPMPVPLLKGIGGLCGQSDKVERLTESLAVSSVKFQAATGWRPSIPMSTELEWLKKSLYP